MNHWKGIMHYILVGINALYLTSLLVTYIWYHPSYNVHDLETDEVIYTYQGLNKWHFIAVLGFNFVNNWCYNQINKANEMGVKPGIGLDLFGVNLLAMLIYSFSNEGIKVYYLVPVYAGYKLLNTCWTVYQGGIGALMGMPPVPKGLIDEDEGDENSGKSNR